MEKNKVFGQLTYKQILGIITYTMVLVLILLNMDVLIKGLKMVLSLLKPFMMGFALAYIFNIPMRYFTKKLERHLKKGVKVCAAILSLVCIAILFTFVISVVVPQLVDSIYSLIEAFPQYAKTAEEFMLNIMRKYNLDETLIEQWDIYSKQIEEVLLNLLKSTLPKVMEITSGVISTVTDLIMAIVSAIYFVITKDTLIQNTRKVLYAFLPENIFQYVSKVLRLSDKTFSNFISGQLVEALIIGVLCYVGAMILRLEYAPILAVVIGCTNIIPIFGPIIGTVFNALLLLFVSPMQAVIFVVFGILLQQFESNLIYPKVVGSSVGLSGVWVLLAVSVGGGLFGALGMILGLPVFAVAYRLFADEVERRTKIKRLKKKEALHEK